MAIQEIIKETKIPEHAYFIYDDEITDFYSWVIPKGDAVEVGAALKPEHTRESFALFKQKV